MSISLLVFKWQPCQKNKCYFFKILTLKRNWLHSMLNNMKTNEPRLTKSFRDILLWILKHKNQAKVRNSKNFGRGSFLKFFRLEKKCFLLPFSYLLIDLKKIWTKIFGLISSWTGCLKILHLVKKGLFLQDLCKWPTNPILLYPLISYVLPEKSFFLTCGIRTYKDEHFELL